MDFEAEDLGLVAAAGFSGDEGRVDLEEHAVEGGAKVGAVYGGVFGGFGVVEIFAAVSFESSVLDFGVSGVAVLVELKGAVTVDKGEEPDSPCAIQSHRFLAGQITLAHRQQRLPFTHDSRTPPKVTLLVLIHHLR